MTDLIWVDYLVLGLLLSFSCLVGLYFGCFGTRQRTTTEYLYGGYKMHSVPVGISLFSSLFGSPISIGLPSEVYFTRAQFLIAPLSILAPCFASYFIVFPVYFGLKIRSPFEYLEMRFHSKIRSMCASLFIFQIVLHAGAVLYACTVTVSRVIEADFITSTWAVGAVCVGYTVLGGVKTVIWTDTLQAVVIIGSAVAILIIGVFHVDGVTSVWDVSLENHKLDIFDMNPNPFVTHSFWTVFVGGSFDTFYMLSLSATSMQRIFSVPNLQQTKMSVIIFGFFYCMMIIIPSLQGLVIYTFYYKCDPLMSKRIRFPDQLLSLFVLDISKHIPGFPGIFAAGVVSAGLSTISSELNTVSGIVVNDIGEKLLNKKFSETAGAVIMKIVASIIGILITYFSTYIGAIGRVFELCVKVVSIPVAVITGITLLGMLFPRANSAGAFVGAVCSAMVTTWVCVGSTLFHKLDSSAVLSIENCPRNLTLSINNTISQTLNKESSDSLLLYKLSYLYYNLFGTIVLILVGIFISLVTKPDRRKIDQKLLSPIVRERAPKNNSGYERAEHFPMVHSVL